MADSSFYLLPTNKLYKKENVKRLKNFPAGYVGNFYRNLSDMVDTVQSNFLSAISADADIPKHDVQKYLLGTSDFAKSIQTDINHYVTRDRINDASFRQKLDPISKNIIRRQNPLELVFEDISTFDSENPVVGSLLREIDLKKKGTDSGFIKFLPSQPGKEFEIKKRLHKLRGVGRDNFVNNNNNQGPPGPGGGDITGLGPPPAPPNIEDLIENGAPPPPAPGGAPPGGPLPFGAPGSGGFLDNLWNNLLGLPSFPGLSSSSSSKPFVVLKIEGDGPIGNNLFGSIGAMMDPKAKEKSKTSQEIDDFLYELPDNGAPTLELGDGLLNSLGNEGQDLFDGVPTKKEEEDTVLQDIIDEYGIPDMKDEMDETGQVPESIYFFYGGDSDQFVEALKFIGIQGQNREFATFLMSDEDRRLMTQNKLSIHVETETGDIFYDNHNTEENFYNFLLSQQNDEAAEVPKKFSCSNSFKKYITEFSKNFSVDDQEKFDLLSFKNSKYLFYVFNSFVRLYGNSRYKLLHTTVMKDSVALEKIADKNKQFLVEKLIQGVEFESGYENSLEKNPWVKRRWREITRWPEGFINNFFTILPNCFKNTC